ncbi:hypothetical protein GP486_003061 [Trichoglossum hirsutum]|uniref:Uncharacterized protein n=1 Tax=Trichoglossum hirsutum TaxID=265104 RepID=A0A9P8RR56_9PEZI|nr:hypothetical protein GP486_003061 [Trichoglossum hirsutum]
MKPSLLLSLHSLVSKIHPPLPLNPRESERLLLLLTSSFRRHLNREYPSLRADELQDQFLDEPGGDGTRKRLHQDVIARPRSAKLMSSAAANHHFVSILTSPLFTKPVHSLPPGYLGEGKRKHNLKDLRRIMDDPMGVFEENVALGTATIHMAAVCLRILMKEILSSPVLSVKDGMAQSGAGTKVLRWMWSSGLSASNEFLADHNFVGALIPFLVAEGHSDVAWAWMNRSFPADMTQNPVPNKGYSKHSATAHHGFLLSTLIKAEMKYGGGVDSAIEILRRAVDQAESILVSCGSTRESLDMKAIRALLAPAGMALYRRCKHLLSSKDLSPKALDALLAVIPKLSQNHELHRAWLRMYHPTEPTTEPALKLLRSAARVGGRLREGVQSERFRTIWIKFGLEAARLLLKEKKWEDGAEVMSILQVSFPEELGLRHAAGAATSGGDAETDEQINLRLLEGLDAALGWKQS